MDTNFIHTARSLLPRVVRLELPGFPPFAVGFATGLICPGGQYGLGRPLGGACRACRSSSTSVVEKGREINIDFFFFFL